MARRLLRRAHAARASPPAWARRDGPRARAFRSRPPLPTLRGAIDDTGGAMLTILFDGVAYGMLLFVLACGLSVTLGLMNFVNLAHGAFAMAGGYVTLILVNREGIPFFAALPIAFVVTALIGALFERTLYVHVYAKSHLDQVLFTIGLEIG